MFRAFSIPFRLAALSLAGAAGAATLDGAEIYSSETVKYGRWEIRMQVAATPGSISSFFTYYNNSNLGSPEPWLEIDIETLGKNGMGFQSNLITGNAATRITSEAFHTSASDLSKGFHTYVLDWTPDSIVYRLDGVVVRKTLGTDQQVKDLTGKSQSYRMNLWATTAADWAGVLDPNKLPIAQTVNWIVYSSYTPGSGPNRSDFTQQWIDDFSSLNTSRWARANWTFDGNMADFTPNNAVVSNGYLMLILSKKGGPANVSPPTDPLGSTRPPVGIGTRPAASPSFRVEAARGNLIVDAGESSAGIVVLSPDGRILARGTGPGIHHFGGLPRGLVLLRTAAGTRLVPMP